MVGFGLPNLVQCGNTCHAFVVSAAALWTQMMDLLIVRDQDMRRSSKICSRLSRSRFVVTATNRNVPDVQANVVSECLGESQHAVCSQTNGSCEINCKDVRSKLLTM